MENLWKLLTINDPKGYYSLEDMQLLCKDPKFEMILESVQYIFMAKQILTPEIRDFLLNSNYDANYVLGMENTRQEYGSLYNINDWEDSLMKEITHYEASKRNALNELEIATHEGSILVAPSLLGNKEASIIKMANELEEDNKSYTSQLIDAISRLKSEVVQINDIKPQLISYEIIKRVTLSFDEVGQQMTKSISNLYGPVIR